MPDDPLDSLKATLGEHYENYVVVVADTRHQCRVIYDNSFAAKGLLNVGLNIVDESFNSYIDGIEIDFGPPSSSDEEKP
jgi:hypothetical protein